MSDSSRTNAGDEPTVFEGVGRRAFLWWCAGLAAALSTSGCSEEDAANALTNAGKDAGAGKPPVLWLTAQDCNGCSINFLNLDRDDERGIPSISSVILDTISLRYHEAIMSGSGHVAEAAKARTIEEGGYILVVEGAIPGDDDRYCVVGGVPIRETLLEAAAGASFVIALGSCATSGGIVAGTPTHGKPVHEILPDRPIIRLPMCPANGEHLLLTIVHLLTEGTVPDLDEQGRPTWFFGGENSVHLHCSRLPAFLADEFLTDWNDPAQKSYCLLLKGCKGPSTKSDCTKRRFHGGITVCTDVGSPCQGCAESTYYDGKPLYDIG